MKSKQDKIRDLEALRELLAKAPHLFVTGFNQITVQQDFQLRKTVREAGGEYKVIKNTLAESASKSTPSEEILGGLTGMNSVAYTEDEPVALAKALTAYAKANPTFTFKAGIVEGRVVDTDEIQLLAEMPSRDELFAKLLYVINAPATNLARAVNGVGRNLAVVLDQGCQENKFSS